MSKEYVAKKLMELANLKAQKELVRLDKEETIKKAVPPEVLEIIADIEAEYAAINEGITKNYDTIVEEIKTVVLELKESVKTEVGSAIYTEGREKWDGKMLNGLALVMPRVKEAWSKGDPYVTIR